jgi:hypothetical protein
MLSRVFSKIVLTSQRLQCRRDQDCQMVYFQTKNPNLGKFLRTLEWELLLYFMRIWNVCITAIWYILG